MAAAKPFRIDREDVERFARLSGDFNPLHLDPVRARRLIFGEAVTHGIHVLMLALDAYLEDARGRLALKRLKATFLAPVPIGGVFTVTVGGDTAKGRKLTVETGGRTALKATALLIEADDSLPEPASSPFQPAEGRDITFAEAAEGRGAVPLIADRKLLAGMFPNLTGRLSAHQAAAILAATRLLSSECPGLNSLITGLSLDFTEAGEGGGGELAYRVENASEEFSLISVAVEGPGVSGSLNAIYRPPAVRQASYQAACEAVHAGEFAGQRALVVGGSRGLGEVTGKLVAGGGGEVWITYRDGRDEAQAVAGEITAGGGRCGAFRFDVTAPPDEPPEGAEEIGEPPTHLHYHATPFIRLNKKGPWDEALFENYLEYYVKGLERTIEAVGACWGKAPLTVIYPSTAFLDRPEPGTAEYAKAKAEGEALCRALEEREEGLRCHCPRLPRMLTDQTNAVTPVETEDAVAVILRLLREI